MLKHKLENIGQRVWLEILLVVNRMCGDLFSIHRGLKEQRLGEDITYIPIFTWDISLSRQGEKVASIGNTCTVVSLLVNDFPMEYHKYYTGDCLSVEGQANCRRYQCLFNN